LGRGRWRIARQPQGARGVAPAGESSAWRLLRVGRVRIADRSSATAERAAQAALDEVGMLIDSAPFRSALHRNTGGRSRRWAGLALSVAIGLAAAIGPAGPGARYVAAADPGSGASDRIDTSIMHEQALEHADDPNSFVPGDAVTVPYRPRAGDTTEVDGNAPVALPAGVASGRSMASSAEGSVWAAQDVAASPVIQAQTQGQAAPAGTVNVLRREVYGFLPYWESVAAPTLNYDILSTVSYFGVGVDGSGNLLKHDSDGSTSTGWAGWTSSWMTNVINNAHAHGTRVALTIEEFAWTTSELNEQVALLSSAANRLNAAQQIAAAVSQRGADGVSLDFEPISSTQGGNYNLFVKTLRAELDKIHPGYELTFCATGSTGYYDIATLTGDGAADAVFIMGYDFRTGSSSYAGSIDPLTSPKPVYDLTQVVKAYMARTADSKIILGLPYYGIAWSTATNDPNATVIKSSCAPTSVFFAGAASLAATNGRHYDSIEQSAWTAYQLNCGGVQTWRELYYDDDQSLAAKYDMINYWNLRGAGIWALGYDAGHPEMANLVAAKFLTDTNPPKAGIVNMPASQSNEGFPVSWTGRDDWNGVKNYDVQVSTDGGKFTAWLTGTTATTSNFQGSSGHSYSFRVRATDGVGNVGPWDLSTVYTASPAFRPGNFVSVRTTVVNERASPDSSATVIATAPAGTILQIIGGPATSTDGLTWYQVTGPFTELNAVAPLFPGLWVAVTDGTTNWVVPITPPNTTFVSAAIDGYSVGTPGMIPSGTGIDRGRVFSPDGDGIRDTMPLSWTDTTAFNDVSLTIYRADGTAAGTIDLGAHAAGAQSYTWNGTLDGKKPLPDGQYMVQVTGTAGRTTCYAPSRAPFVAGQMSRFGILIDTTPSGTYYPLPPVRVLDTRKGVGLSGAFVSGKSRSLAFAGAHGVPSNAIAVTGNLTVTQATVAGWVRFGSSTAGTSSTINFRAGDNKANGVTLGLAADGSLSGLYYTSSGKGSVHLIFDLTGYFVSDAKGATFVAVKPTRIVDTRVKKGISAPLTPNKVATFSVAGLAGVPANAIAVTGNATVTGQTGVGYVTVAPKLASGAPPTSSTLNFPLGDNRANNVVVPLSGGHLQVEYVGKSKTSVQFIFDVTGYFVPGLSGATFVPVAPGRVVDSRKTLGFKGPLKNGASTPFAVSGQVSVHPVAVAVVGNLTVTGQTSKGWLAAAPGPVTSTSTLNFPLGDNRANGFVSLLGPGGILTVTFGGSGGATTQVVVDILGYYR
jgi:spore germination protein YaaH